MKAIVYRLNRTEGLASWRPRSLVDMRGPVFPDEYHEILTLEADNIYHALDQYPNTLGDVIFFGEGDEMMSYVAAPYGWEMVKFGKEWRSPD